MSLYYEAADVLTVPATTGGSLKSRIFTNKDLRSQPAQIYALVVESCKWSLILKEVIERTALLSLERKLTPILSLLLVHDLLLAKKGIALPATHGLRVAVERHKTRLHAELTKARVARKMATMDALKQYIDSGEEGASTADIAHPRWIRINALKTQLEDQLETTFANFERVGTVHDVRKRGSPRLYMDIHVPNVIAVPASVDLTRSEAYTSGAIIFQDKASCFPAYMLDPLLEDGDIIDTCAAPGNKTTHIAAILLTHAPEAEDSKQTLHAFEKDKKRAETLQKMLNTAGCQDFTQIHGGQDFLKVDPNAPEYRNVGALLLDPSCSGSGIIGRDEMPELHLPSVEPSTAPVKGRSKSKSLKTETLKRKRDDEKEPTDIIDDNGVIASITSESDLQARLEALSSFQLSLLLHSFAFPSAHKITYSTCSIYRTENEDVVVQALDSKIAKERGWRILRRDEQVRGLQEWPIRGDREACAGEKGDELAEACIRANKGDEHGTMGFFLAGFVRDSNASGGNPEAGVLRDEKGFIVRDLMGIPVRAAPEEADEWNGFVDEDIEFVEDESKDLEVQGSPLVLKQVEVSNEAESARNFNAESVKKRKREARRV